MPQDSRGREELKLLVPVTLPVHVEFGKYKCALGVPVQTGKRM